MPFKILNPNLRVIFFKKHFHLVFILGSLEVLSRTEKSIGSTSAPCWHSCHHLLEEMLWDYHVKKLNDTRASPTLSAQHMSKGYCEEDRMSTLEKTNKCESIVVIQFKAREDLRMLANEMVLCILLSIITEWCLNTGLEKRERGSTGKWNLFSQTEV